MTPSLEDEDEVVGAYAAWLLSDSGPDDWHRGAMGWNWDFLDPGLFLWVARQPDCDRATALLLFWKTQPDYYLQFRGDPAAVPAFNREGFDLLREIRSRWQTGLYTRSELAFDLAKDFVHPDFAALEREHGGQVATDIPPDMRGPLPGRRLDDRKHVDGIPERFWPEDLR